MRIFLNKIVMLMISIDFVINFAFGAYAPVFAIFLTDNIQGGDAQVAGFAAAVYWVVKSLFQLPIARFLDNTNGEKDDFFALLLGYLGGAASLLMYPFASLPTHVYLIEAFFGISMAVAVPAWYGIFTRHIDRGSESFEWSMESVFSVGMATAASGAIGGMVVTHFGFNALFFGAGTLAIIGSFLLIFLYPHIASNVKSKGLEHAAMVEKAAKKLPV